MLRIAVVLLYFSVSFCSLCSALFDGYDKSIHFELDWKGPWHEANFEKSLYTEVLPITTAANEKYRCVVPVDDESRYITKTANEYIGPSARSLLEKEWTDMTKHGCSYRIDTYWTYELCHGDYMRQYHQDEVAGKTRIQEYYLGYFPKAQQKLSNTKALATPASLFEFPAAASELAALPVIKADGTEFPYYEILIDGGTKCDVSNRPRQSRLRFICVPNGGLRIQSVDEVSSCEYVVVVQSGQLCRHPAYKSKTMPVHQISCFNDEGNKHVVPDGLMNEVMSLKEMHGNMRRHLHSRLHVSNLVDENKLYLHHADKTKKVQLASMEGLIDPSYRTTISTETGGGDDTEEFVLEVDTGNGKDRTQILFKRAKFPPSTAGEIGGGGAGGNAAGDVFSGDNIRAMAEQVLKAGGLGEKLAGAQITAAGSSSSEKAAAPEIADPLDFFLGKKCLYGGSGYWKVEYCFNRHVRQFHDNPDSPSSAKILLGRWNEAAHRAWVGAEPKERRPRLVQGPQPYQMVKHHYGTGDYCHDINAHRQTEVVFKCKSSTSGQSHTSSTSSSSIFLLEPATCSYTLMVESPFVCLLAENADADGIIREEYISKLLSAESPSKQGKQTTEKEPQFGRKEKSDILKKLSQKFKKMSEDSDADSTEKPEKADEDDSDDNDDENELGEHIFHFELSSADLAELSPDEAVEKFRTQVSKTMRQKMKHINSEDTVRALHSSMQKILKQFADPTAAADSGEETDDEQDEDEKPPVRSQKSKTDAESLKKPAAKPIETADENLQFLHPDLYTPPPGKKNEQVKPGATGFDPKLWKKIQDEMDEDKRKRKEKQERTVPNAFTMGKTGEAKVTQADLSVEEELEALEAELFPVSDTLKAARERENAGPGAEKPAKKTAAGKKSDNPLDYERTAQEYLQRRLEHLAVNPNF